MRDDLPKEVRDLLCQYAAEYNVEPDQLLAKADQRVIAARSAAMAHLATMRDPAGVLRYSTAQLEDWFGVGKAAISLARARGRSRNAVG